MLNCVCGMCVCIDSLTSKELVFDLCFPINGTVVQVTQLSETH